MLSTFWQDWGGAIEWAIGVFGGWWARAGATRLQSQRNSIDAATQHTDEMRLALEREQALQAVVLKSRCEAQESWRILYKREAVLIAYHAAAIGARLKVHEQDVANGRPPTPFAPLPGYPSAQEVDGISQTSVGSSAGKPCS